MLGDVVDVDGVHGVGSLRVQMDHVMEDDLQLLKLLLAITELLIVAIESLIDVMEPLIDVMEPLTEPLVDVSKLLMDAVSKGVAEGANIRAIVLRMADRRVTRCAVATVRIAMCRFACREISKEINNGDATRRDCVHLTQQRGFHRALCC